MSFAIPDSPFGDRVRQRLDGEEVAWLTTVSKDGTPRPSPIWFWWDGESILIYSKDGTSRTRNLARDSSCSFNFNSDGTGGDIVILEGIASISEDPPSTEISEYQAKYEKAIPRIGMNPDSFAAGYPIPIRFYPKRLRGF